jgi:glucose/arabinose dehydrogenase
MLAVGFGLGLFMPVAAQGGTLPEGFQETVAFSGLTQPTAVSLSADGRVFVAEKRGVIKVFDNLDDVTPTVFADLTEDVFNYWDRGLLGMTLDPQFPADPYVYVIYTRDAPLGGTSPTWGDDCPDPPGPTDGGCVASGRVLKLTVDGDVARDEKEPLITDWCQQFPSHSVGDLAFDADGALYVSGGDAANFDTADWGQFGIPDKNPCGDPPGGVGGEMTPPTAEGGALRSQDIRTMGDPAALNGTIARVDPVTGLGLADNPFARSGSLDANARRIVAHGLRNPFRLTVRPGTNEIWAADVGWGGWEEVNRLLTANDSVADNFGWPCYEGKSDGVSNPEFSYESAGLDLCDTLYGEGPSAVVAPYYAYGHTDKVVPLESCSTGSSSIAGIDFYTEGPFPSLYDGALFFADYSRECIWAMPLGTNGLPDPAKLETFDAGIDGPVDLEIGPDGALYFVGFDSGKVFRVTYTEGNHPPIADAKATPANGPAPLDVELDATGSTDQDPGETLAFAWDLDEDGEFDDSTEAKFSHLYAASGIYTASVRVSDLAGASDTAEVEIQAGNTPPEATITTPLSSLKWGAGEQIPYAATATDAQQDPLPEAAFDWEFFIEHCPSDCHEHPLQEIKDKSSGSITGFDHEFPSKLRLELTVTDAGGLTGNDSVTIDPRTVQIELHSNPAGLQLSLNTQSAVAPFTRSVIDGSHNTVIAPLFQPLAGVPYSFEAWSDGGDPAHTITVDNDVTLTAKYAAPIIFADPPLGPVPIDATPPQTRIVGGPPPKARVREARKPRVTFRFTSSEATSATFRCKLDRSRWRSCASPRSYSNLALGRHKFSVQAADAAGNADPTPASRSFRLIRSPRDG